jgi:hypothetical protein
LPFNPFIPNAETIAALMGAGAGNLPRVKSVEDLFRALNADGIRAYKFSAGKDAHQ